MRTLEDINAELEQVRQKLDRAWKLSAVMEDLKAQHEERKRAAEEALKVLYREQEDVEELVKYAEKYPKPASPVIYYISSQSLPAYVKQLPVEGTFGTGITDNGNDTFTISHNIWKNVTVFETYRGETLDRVAMVGTDSPDRSTTLVRYPAGSTRIEAVAWDGTRTLVYGSR